MLIRSISAISYYIANDGAKFVYEEKKNQT